MGSRVAMGSSGRMGGTGGSGGSAASAARPGAGKGGGPGRNRLFFLPLWFFDVTSRPRLKALLPLWVLPSTRGKG